MRASFDPMKDPICSYIFKHPGCSRADVIRAVYDRPIKAYMPDPGYMAIKRREKAGFIVDHRKQPRCNCYQNHKEGKCDHRVVGGGLPSRLTLAPESICRISIPQSG